MITFQEEPDPIFLAIVDGALVHVREVHLARYKKEYRPTRTERQELEGSYREHFPELAPLFTRLELVRLIDRLRRAHGDQRPRFELYDLEADPHEARNLADDPGHARPLADLQAKLKAFQLRTGDPWRSKWEYE